MKTVFKYELCNGKTILNLPKDYKILNVKKQYEKPVIYILVDTDVIEKQNIEIIGCGTGFSIDFLNVNLIEYIDTLLFYEESLVLHFFIKID